MRNKKDGLSKIRIIVFLSLSLLSVSCFRPKQDSSSNLDYAVETILNKSFEDSKVVNYTYFIKGNRDTIFIKRNDSLKIQLDWNKKTYYKNYSIYVEEEKCNNCIEFHRLDQRGDTIHFDWSGPYNISGFGTVLIYRENKYEFLYIKHGFRGRKQ